MTGSARPNVFAPPATWRNKPSKGLLSLFILLGAFTTLYTQIYYTKKPKLYNNIELTVAKVH